ncbi:TetR/AcrR family transcriptional regulator [Castellaniella sp.]|uniref:TetR/AcrR family transcriptional regulator n=1 Tax=Castellaniella sp. TaxID=1955812 RepID=UPI003C733977
MTNDTRQHILDTGQAIISGKGFSAVGLNEILKASGVPKGSFYHYFSSKEAFGEALIESYFTNYLSTVDALFSKPGLSAAERLMHYFTYWLETQTNCDPKGKCLVVKLAAEVSDLSEAMRVVLGQGTSQAISRLKDIIQEGIHDKSLPMHLNPQIVATTLYQLWLGASICAKISHTAAPLESALVATEELLGLPLQQSH